MVGDKVTYNDHFDKDLDVGIDKLKVKIDELYESFKKITIEQAKSIGVSKEVANSNKQLLDEKKKLDAEEKKNAISKQKLIDAEKKLTVEYKKSEIILQKHKKDLQDEAAYGKTATDSLRAKEQQLSRLRAEYKRAGAEAAKSLVPQIKQLTTDVNKLNSNIGLNQGKVGSYFKSMTDGMKSMVGMYLGFQGIRMLFSNITETLFGFEKAMSGVKAISGATGAEFKLLENDAMRLGATTSKTAVEVAGLQKEYALLGFSTKEIIAATEATIMLSQATGEDLAASAATAGATVRGFGLDATETQRVVDVMADSFTSSALNLERFSESMKYIAPVAKVTNTSLEESSAMLSVLADAGIHGSMAGTALRMIMLKMGEESGTLTEKIQKLSEKGLGLADANDEVGQRAMTALLVLADQSKKLPELTAQYDNAAGSAKEMARIQMDNVAGSITILKSAWEGLILKMSGANSSIRTIVDSLTSFVGFLTRNAAAIGYLIKGVVALTISTKAYKLGVWASSLELKSFIGNLFAKRTAMIADTVATEGAVVATKSLNTAMKLNPIGLIISALAIAIPLLLEFQGGLDNIVNSTDKLIEGTEKLSKEAIINVETLILSGKDELTSINETIKKYEEELKGLARANDIITEKWNKADDEQKKKLENTIINITDGISATTTVLEDLRKQKDKINTDLIKSEQDLQNEIKKTSNENNKNNIKKLEQERDYELSMARIRNDGLESIFMLEFNYNNRILDLKKQSGVLNEIQYKTEINKEYEAYRKFFDNISNLQPKTTEQKTSEGTTTLNSTPKEVVNVIELKQTFLQKLGLDEDTIGAIKTGYEQMYDIASQHADDMLEIAEKKNESAKNEVQQKLDALNLVKQAQIEGNAFNIAAAQREYDEAVKNQKRAENLEQKRVRKKLAIESMEQAGSLITGSASIWGTYSTQPWIAIPLIATMWASFGAAKIKAFQETKYADGGLEYVKGGTHNGGNDTSLGINNGKRIKVQRGEALGIINDKAVNHYGSKLPGILNSINKMTLSGINNMPNENTIINFNTTSLETGINKLVKQNSKKIYQRGNSTIVECGNVTKIYRNV